MTLTEKILARAAGKKSVKAGENVWVQADILMTHDVCGPGTIGIFHERFGRKTNTMLWVQAEIIAMATDLAEFVGAAIGLYLVFGIALFPAGVITAFVAFGILALEQRGYRKFELAIIALLALIAAGFVYTFFSVGHEDYGAMAKGVIPSLSGDGALALAVGIIGATVMPHVVYLHSALQKNRIRPANKHEMRTLLKYNRLDCIIGLGIAGVVNLSMLCIAAALFHVPGLSNIDDLIQIHSELGTLVSGGAAATVSELRRRFDEYLSAMTKGKDTTKVRIVLE